MALVSPGIQISINDQSQYVSNAVGSVPLVVLATAQDKTYNGAVASGTSAANAGKLQSFTSQRDLVTAMGTPTFRLSSAGTPVHAGELNEYGLMTAYSALGLGNQLYAIRADIDLDQLVGTSVRPNNTPADGTFWLDTVNTEWGIYSLNRTDSDFDHVDPLVIVDPTQVENDNAFAYNVPKPKQSIGTIGSYAVVAVETNGENPTALRLWKKTGTDSVSTSSGGPGSNAWVQVGSTEWQLATPAVTGTITVPSVTIGTTLVLNGITITATGETSTTLASDINTAAITGVKAAAVGGKLVLFCTTAAAVGRVTVASGTMNTNTVLGIPTGTYHAPFLFYGNYAEQPTGGWFTSDSQPRPTGSVWWKLGSTGVGLNIVLKKYSSATGTFQSLNVPAYFNTNNSIYGFDPIGGGVNIATGQNIVTYSVTDTTTNGLRLFTRRAHTAAEVNNEAIAYTGTPTTFTAGESFSIDYTTPGIEEVGAPLPITLSGTTAASFVTDILAANIPYVTAAIESNGTISITHQTGGQIVLRNVSGTPLADAGFETDATGQPTKGSGYIQNTVTGAILIGLWNSISVYESLEITDSAPYAAPADGTYWYYSSAADVDVMINNNGWKGYKNVSSDSRGYNLGNTDPAGVIVTATEPLTQSDASALVAGDLWLDTSDLINYPKIYRYTGTVWSAIDTSDQTTSNGIVFADARWGTDGTSDPIVDALPSITSLLTSNYLDLDAPDYRLYPRGALLFNTRRSGYNVKQYRSNYYNDVSFPNVGANSIGLPTSLPAEAGAWISASGLNTDGSMKAGTAAQRAIVVAAMSSAIDSNLEVREDLYQFNLLVAPGYPELIDNLVTLNSDRGDTGFVIGDTPMTLAATSTAINNWNSNTDGNGLATASPYLAVYYPSGVTTDLSGNTVAVPASYSVLRTYLYSDNVSYPWFAPAGTHRGLVSNIQDVGYVNANTGAWTHNSIGQGLRDSLYTMNINPITQLPGVGIVVWGQETKSGTSTARNRVNVVRLENYLRTIFKSISNGYLFEPNDQVTRKSIATQIESALNDILSKRGVYDFLVVCDSSNNTSSTIANNQLYVDVAIEPARDVEFIYIPIALYNPGALASLGTSST
jgi:Phage tail sheath C-terminal domain